MDNRQRSNLEHAAQCPHHKKVPIENSLFPDTECDSKYLCSDEEIQKLHGRGEEIIFYTPPTTNHNRSIVLWTAKEEQKRLNQRHSLCLICKNHPDNKSISPKEYS